MLVGDTLLRKVKTPFVTHLALTSCFNGVANNDHRFVDVFALLSQGWGRSVSYQAIPDMYNTYGVGDIPNQPAKHIVLWK